MFSNFYRLFVPSVYQYTIFLLSICKFTNNEPFDYRTKRTGTNLISQNWGRGWEQSLKNHSKWHLPVKATHRVRPLKTFNNLLAYRPLHFGSEIFWFPATFGWSYRSSVVDYTDVGVLPLPLIIVEWRKTATTPVKNHSRRTYCDYYGLGCIYSHSKIERAANWL
jgi:hypothetical protein